MELFLDELFFSDNHVHQGVELINVLKIFLWKEMHPENLRRSLGFTLLSLVHSTNLVAISFELISDLAIFCIRWESINYDFRWLHISVRYYEICLFLRSQLARYRGMIVRGVQV